MFYKYLSVSKDDKKWGLYILNAGHHEIEPYAKYPPDGHPKHHWISWEKGRILQEFQLVYLYNGKGQFESRETGLHSINSGSVLIIFPGRWHRYKPVAEQGWSTYWIGFKGHFAQGLYRNECLNPQQPLYFVGRQESLVQLFIELLDAIKDEGAGFQQICSGIFFHLLGHVVALSKRRHIYEHGREDIVKQAKALLMESLDSTVKYEDIAKQLGISYTAFRRFFKQYTGLAPGQYHMQLRVERSKELLLQPDIPIKEIAVRLGFKTPFYYNRIFKQKVGISPGLFRKQMFGYLA